MYSGDYSLLVYSSTLDLNILGEIGGGANKLTNYEFIVYASYYKISMIDDPCIP